MTEQSTRQRAKRWSLKRPVTCALVACTALCLLIPRPGFADPGGGTRIPDTGAIPQATAPLNPAGTGTGTTPAVTPVTGPMATEIMNRSSQVEALGEQLKQAQIDAQAAHDAAASTYDAWQQAQTKATQLRAIANATASDAYKQAESMGPFGAYADAMHQLGVLAPGFADSTPGGVAGSQTAARDATDAEAAATNAKTAYDSASATEQSKNQARDALNAKYTDQSSSLATLKAQNSSAVAEAEAAQEATDQRLAPGFAAGTNVDGMVANPIAIRAVQFALAQRPKPYKFGAEGPNAYDCSGLTWASYRHVGITIPRVAKDQYHQTTKIDVSKILPGDLLFFSRTSTTDWTTISHVGMYIGDGKMVEAPTTGDVVKVATVWWSAFYGATRIVSPVKAPKKTTTTPPKSPSHKPSQKPTGPTGGPTGPGTGTPTGGTTPTPNPPPTSSSSGADPGGSEPSSPASTDTSTAPADKTADPAASSASTGGG
jgi:cell wall-associated NlpC family hydrolase